MAKRFLVFGELFLLIFVCEIVSADVIINEVMAKPSLNTKENQWVELFNNDSFPVNLSGWSISSGTGENDTLNFGYQGSILEPYSYAIITEELSYVYYDFNVSPSALKIYVDDDGIGEGNLNYNGENIMLYDENYSLVSNFSYSYTKEGFSWSFIDDGWYLVENVTPGYCNSLVNPCNPGIEIEIDKYIYEDNEVVYFTPLVKGNYLYRIDYWIEDLFGDIVKSRIETGNSNQKQWTTDVSGEDSIYIIKANLTYSNCDDISLNNNFAQKMIGVKGNKAINTSFLNIEEVYLGTDDKAKFGDNLRVKVSVYKGDTDKQSVQLWVEDNEGNEISKVTRVHAYEKFRSYNLTLAVQIEPNCNSKYKEDYYNLVFEGLDQRDKRRIRIEGITTSLCEKVNSSGRSSGINYEILEVPSEIEVGEKFSIRIKVVNNANDDEKLTIWSYVYRGSKCYSNSREGNLEEINIPGGSSIFLELNDIVESAEEGDYKLKIKFKKEDKKTEDEITKDIGIKNKLVTQSVKEVVPIMSENSEKVIKQTINPVTGAIVYESKEKKEEKIAIYFFCIILVLLIAYFMWGNEI